jgi:hypothetical protein
LQGKRFACQVYDWQAKRLPYNLATGCDLD